MRKLTQAEFLKIFFLFGTLTFFGIGIANIFTNAYIWKDMLLSAKVSAVLSNLFNFAIAIFFWYSLKGTQKKDVPELTTEEIEDAIKGVKKNGEKRTK